MSRKSLISKLVQGEAKVTFTKKDGTERVMKCTLKEDVVPAVESKETTRKVNEEVLAVWDLEKSAWRSFRIDSIKDVEFV